MGRFVSVPPSPPPVRPGAGDTGIEVLGEIGRGAQAVVHRVRHRGAEYAMKVLRTGGDTDPAQVREFHRQAALLAAVADPGLARVHAVGTTGGHPYVLMDLVDGEPLGDRLRRGPLTAPRTLAMAVDVASALATAHANDLVHRDVKPDNILVAADGRAKLVDFGLAGRLPTGADRAAPAGEPVAGTLTYCAPEQTGMLNRPVDGRSDLYALGVVLFECVTGAPPFAAADTGELLRLHATAPVPDPRAFAPGLGAGFAAVVVRLLAKDPDDRYQSAHGLLADLRRLAAEPDAALAPGADDGPVTPAEVPLTGRDDELAALRARWAAARAGHGGILLLQGPAGSGKTRLATALAADAGVVLHGRSTPGDRRPLAPIRAAIDAYVRAHRSRPGVTAALRAAAGPSAALVKNLSPALAEVLAAPDPDGEVGQDRYASAVAGFLAGLARAGGPLLLRLDDAQWFDEGTVRVLRDLALDAAGAPLLAVVTGRPDGEPPAVPADTTVTLAPLDAAGTAALVDAMCGGVRCDAGSAARIANLTGGNPFAVLAYVRAVLDAGLLRPVWGRWETDHEGLRALRLPADSAELMLRRTGELAAESRRLLAVAAVAGSTFGTGLVAEVTGTDPARVAEVAADAVRRGLLERHGAGHALPHESIRTALRAGLTEADVRDLHDRIAAVLDRDGPDTDVYALAQHCAAGHPAADPGRMLRAGHAAGARALAEHAPGTALVFLEQAAAVAAAAGLPTGSAFRQLLGTAYHLNGRFAEAIATLTGALEVTTDPRGRAAIHCLLARVHDRAWSGAEELATVDRGLAELGLPMPRRTPWLVLSSVWLLIVGCLVRVTRLGYGTARGADREYYRMQSELYHHGASGSVRCLRPLRALGYGVRLIYPGNRLGRSPERASGLVALTMALRMIGLHRVAGRMVRAATRLAGDLGDPALLAYIAWMDAIARHGSGHDQGEQVARVLAEHDRWLDSGLALDCHAVLGWDRLLRGEVAEAEAGAARRQKWVDAGGHADRSAVVAIDAGLLALRGRAGEAAVATARSVRNAGEIHEVVDAIIARVQTACERDDLGASFDEAVADFDALGLRPVDLLPAQHSYYVYLAYGRVAQGDQTVARAAVATLRASRRPLIAAHHRVLSAAVAPPAEALRLLAAAEPLLRAVDAPLVAHEAAVVRARALTALGVPGEAGRQARTAAAIADAHGWPHRARRVEREFRLDAGGSRRSGAAGSAHGARWAALEQVSLAASRVLDPQRLTRIALDETVRLLGAERAILFLVDPGTQVLAPSVGRDAAGQDLAELAGYSATVVDRVRHSREPLVVAGTEEGEALGAHSVVLYGLRSILVAPLQLDERLLGVVYLDSRVAKGVFTADDADLLTAVTHHIAVALETARAAQLEVAVSAATRQRDLAEALRAAMARLSAILDPALVLAELRRTACEMTGAASGRLLPPGEAVHDPAALAVPLADRDGPVGTLVLTAGRPGEWGDADRGIAEALAGQAMVAYDNARLFSRVNELATTDSLTGVANRRHFFALAAAVTADGPPVTALMIDIDHFKNINDTYGHQAGDDVIRGVAGRLGAAMPAGAVLGRYGGEEFALLVRGDAGDLGETLRAVVAGTPVPTRGGPVPVTVSVGVARRCGPDAAPDAAPPEELAEALLGRADGALYAAKRAGRNRVVAHPA